jgi:hypothetical protein
MIIFCFRLLSIVVFTGLLKEQRTVNREGCRRQRAGTVFSCAQAAPSSPLFFHIVLDSMLAVVIQANCGSTGIGNYLAFLGLDGVDSCRMKPGFRRFRG